MEFRETFSSLIHENNEITNIQKLHYLKASLFGEAAEIIKCLEFTSNNYIIAFNAICERYNNPRMLVHNHVKSILDLETSTKESASKLRKINESLFKHVSVLKSLATEAELLDAILIHIVSNKLDPTTFRGWESFKNTLGTHIPSLNQFKEFIKNSANLLESLESKQPKPYLDKGKTCSKSFVSSGPICALCKQSHYLSKCDRFHKLTPPDRLAKAKELKVCINCLSKGHFVNQCNSTFTCRLCGSKHHTSLHIKSKEPSVEQLPALSHAEIPDRSRTISAFSSNTTQVLLPTAIGQIMDSTGKLYKIRILLDSGSQSNFIKSSLCKKLKLPVQSINASISGLAQASSLVHSKCDVEVHANQSPFKLQLFFCLVLDEITGPVGYQQDSRVQCHLSCTEELPDQLNKFWELEHYPSTKALSSEEKACESHYLQNTKRNSDGYADDVAVIVLAKGVDEIECKIEMAIREIKKWLQNNHLELCEEKTEVILLSSKKNTSHRDLNAMGRVITPKPKIKYQGVWLDSKLTFAAHIKETHAPAGE
uniref:Peptidase aspartic putative domain-containing protein n=1 Tax=Dendroctonus ponderosae TaxID=77166 RepID=A0AAR5PX68_DENPD